MIILLTIICSIVAIVLSLLKLFTNVLDDFQNIKNDTWVQCSNIRNEFDCLKNINCELYNIGGNRNSFETCGQSGVIMGRFGY